MHMNKNLSKNLFAVIAGLTFAASPLLAGAASTFSYGAWIPFWQKEAGAEEISLRLPKFQNISPFSYEVNPGGTLKDSLKIDQGFWPDWFTVVRAVHTKIIPSVAWVDGDAIHALLSNTTLRRLHASAIVAMVKAERFDGADIDYENKMAETSPYFSLFIQGLSDKLHAAKKTLSCSVEPRTPAVARFAVIPKDLAFANDYKVLNKYCDEIRVMAYDQGNFDLQLDATKGSSDLYMPVADPDWVEKVIKESISDGISPKKMVLGIPTYGYIYEASWSNGVTTYKRLSATTFQNAMNLASGVGATPTRNSAGELSLTYVTSTSMTVPAGLIYTVSSTMPLILSPQATGTIMRFVSFSDASSNAEKITLAKKYNLKGVEFFKFDGATDPALWDVIK
jgi:spore germination protein YaaH